MKVITSRDNPLYKELKHLASSSQARRRANQSLLDGVHLCQAYLQHVGLPTLCLVSDASTSNAEVAGIVAECEQGRARCISLPAPLFASLSQVEQGIGLLFVIETPLPRPPATITQTAVLLDNVQDPGNVGSILRSAAAAGISQVYCGNGTAFAWSPKVLRAGMGAHFLIEIFEHVELGELLHKARVPVLATSSHATQMLYEVDLRQPLIWLFGHEGQGVAPDLLAFAGSRVAIPHLGEIESLNVAASAAVCFFEQVRQKLQNRQG